MKKIVYAVFLLLFITAGPVNAYEKNLDVDELLSLYIDTWETVDELERKKILKQIWTRRGVHQTPFTHSKGIAAINEEIKAFQSNYPGATVRFENIKQVDNHIVVDFTLESLDGAVLATGVDYFKVSKRGRLIRVIGFF